MASKESDSTTVRGRRRFPRWQARLPVRFKVVNERTSIEPYQEGTTLDLGRGGLGFETTAEVRIGDCLALHLIVPGRRRVVAALVAVRRVARIAPRAGSAAARYEVGVCFLWPGWHDAETHSELVEFLREARGDLDPT